ncbi:mitochondrial Rho GTPase 1 isoform X2 [Physcomitrium patens]|uniref:mitochondrial Rho GTPase 1 isoform X2 n=1 Tax=Physcomitrium patens TaxID=3218 RepID=UPI000D17831B|nr:mitochondrial Rho GTPase 1-like isoform X2 [Physcomitrium patens]|eukprot:XP_024381368.1 mitochondrial Rho GTPase 1-like isoform X2 [Physcomitrella patens]
MAEEDGQGARSRCQVVVVGDHGTGKSGLIIALATDSFPDKPPPVLPPTCLPPDFYPSRVSLTIVDTSSRQQDKIKTETECKKADAIVLTYSDDLPRTLDRLSTYWLPELRRLEIKVPIVVVGCKLDLHDDRQSDIEQIMAPLMQEYREIETIIECSALKQVQKAVLHPTAPLFDQETRTLKPRCVRALKRIFMLCDRDKDGALNDAELNDFQVKCFNAPLQLSEIDEVKNVVSEKMAEGVNVDGLTLTGFLFLHALFIEKGRLETTWTVLRKYGYDDEIKLRDDLLQYPSFKRCADAFVELTEKALDFLKRDFVAFDADGDCALRPQQLEELFSTAPSSPWTELTYSDVAETNQVGGLTLNGFLSLWALMTMLEPRKSLSHLIYIGYPDNPSSAFHITNRRRRDRRRQRSDRVVYQCYIFGANKCGKSALLNALIGRPFTEAYERTEDTRYAVNVVDQIVGGRKTLVLREIIEESVSSLFEKKHALSSCDVAAFVYDCADAQSWKRAYELLVQVIAHQEITGYEIPCMIISAKDDLESVPSCTKGSTRVCTDMGLEATISVSTKLGDVGNLFQKIVDAAQHPHRSIPKTEAGRKFKHYRCLIQWSLTVAAVGFGAAVAGNAIYRLCVRRKC